MAKVKVRIAAAVDHNSKPEATLEEVETIIGMVEELKPKVRTALWLLRGRLTP